MSVAISLIDIYEDALSDNGYDMYLIDCTDNSVTLTLDSAYDSKVFFIRRIDTNGSSTCTITSDSELINGNQSISLSLGQAVQLVSYSGAWYSF